MGEQPSAPASGLVLWGVSTPRTPRPYWAVHELALHYETRAILPRGEVAKSAEFTQLNPRNKLPMAFIIAESQAIPAYLAQTYRSAIQ